MQAGDKIVKLATGPEQMPVAAIDALLYLPGHTRSVTNQAIEADNLSRPYRKG